MKNYLKQVNIPILYLAVLLIVVLIVMCSCKTKYVSVPEYHKEYVSKTDSFVRVDTVKEREWMTIKEVDSVGLAELGLQLSWLKKAYVIERNKNKEKLNRETKLRVDTILKSDYIRVPYPVERKLNGWEKIKMDVGGIAIGAVSVVALVTVIWLTIRIRRKIKQ